MIRAALPDESDQLRAVERAAGERFRDVGMDDIADAEPMSAHHLVAHAEAARSWVAVDDSDEPVGYVAVDLVDGCAHIEQISVLPGHQGRGLARTLIEEVEHWAEDQGLPAMTLTTFAEVPWNRPLYEHLGFVILDEDQLGPELRAVREHEAELGLDPTLRVCMRRRIPRFLGPQGQVLIPCD